MNINTTLIFLLVTSSETYIQFLFPFMLKDPFEMLLTGPLNAYFDKIKDLLLDVSDAKMFAQLLVLGATSNPDRNEENLMVGSVRRSQELRKDF